MSMSGKDEFVGKLKGLSGPQVVRAANRVVYVGADKIRAEVFRSISAGSISGKGHVRSAPGEPPNRDTGVLQAHIETANPEPLTATVTSSAPYAASLEFGTSRMAARPYMRPARDKMEPEINKLFVAELTKLVGD